MAKKKRTAPQKQCPKCGAAVHARKAVCDCGHIFASKKPVRKKPVKKPGAKKSGDQISLSALKEAKKLAEKVGGVERAKEAINALAQLTD